MYDIYFWTTPNGYKISILLEELALPYRVIPIHIGKGEATDTVSSSFRTASEITTRSCNG